MTIFVSIGPQSARDHLLLAPGAGAPMTSPFMTDMAVRLAARGLRVHRFDFDYMAQRPAGGPRRPPPKAELLLDAYCNAVGHLAQQPGRPGRLFIGGKSLGGRVASMTADGLFRTGAIGGLICLGYPFHPPGQPTKVRTAHLANLACPALIVQGTRDPFGTRQEVHSYPLSEAITVHWVESANHDLVPLMASGLTKPAALDGAADAIAHFIASITS